LGSSPDDFHRMPGQYRNWDSQKNEETTKWNIIKWNIKNEDCQNLRIRQTRPWTHTQRTRANLVKNVAISETRPHRSASHKGVEPKQNLKVTSKSCKIENVGMPPKRSYTNQNGSAHCAEL
jgi:hypothetical protein